MCECVYTIYIYIYIYYTVDTNYLNKYCYYFCYSSYYYQDEGAAAAKAFDHQDELNKQPPNGGDRVVQRLFCRGEHVRAHQRLGHEWGR